MENILECKSLSVNLANEIEKLGPFGAGNHKPKIIKDFNGNQFLCVVTGNPSVSYSRGYGMGVMSATAEWTQVGDANNIDDLYAAGAIVGKS